MTSKLVALVTLICCVVATSLSLGNNRLQQLAGVPDTLSDRHIASIDSLYNRQKLVSFTKPLLVVRYVNSKGHEDVRTYLKTFLSARQWTVEEDTFIGTMPNRTTFNGANIVASSKPVTSNTRRIILACHWDSKYEATYDFIGATDSAVPCGMMLWLADILQPLFADSANKQLLDRTDVALQLVFFDGEEAIEEWTDTDSIYGSRNLADRWERENKIASIDLFVLLDLLGAQNPRFYSFFDNTYSFFRSLTDSEYRLRRYWSSVSSRQNAVNSIFGSPMTAPGQISDDHLPFLRRNVPILHLIPYPFPDVWHTRNDDAAHIHWPTVDRFARIMAVFTLRHLNALIVSNNGGSSATLMIPDATLAGPMG